MKAFSTTNTFCTLLTLAALLLTGCMEYGPISPADVTLSGRGVFITNEGNFTYGNASLCYYDIDQSKLFLSEEGANDLFLHANGIPLGDVAQSSVLRGTTLYIVVNNSGVIFAIDRYTGKIKGTIRGLTSPRYLHFFNDEKAYVTDLYARAITIINPSSFQIIGRIETHGPKGKQHATEQMVAYDNLVFTNCWAYDNQILVIDSDRDQVVDSIQVGLQPTSLALDRYGKIWTLTDGGYEGNSFGHEEPKLYRIDALTRRIEKVFTFPIADSPSKIALNGTCDTLYFINRSVWRMDVQAESLPDEPFMRYAGTIYYGLAVDPKSSEVYIADAIDYVQNGVVYRYSPQGVPLDTLRTGIIPAAFCFAEK